MQPPRVTELNAKIANGSDRTLTLSVSWGHDRQDEAMISGLTSTDRHPGITRYLRALGCGPIGTSIPLDQVADIGLVQGPLMRACRIWSLYIQIAGSTDKSPAQSIVRCVWVCRFPISDTGGRGPATEGFIFILPRSGFRLDYSLADDAIPRSRWYSAPG
jgi:hypothetical protein